MPKFHDCPNCKGRLVRFYTHEWGNGKTRFFKATNLFQCERCRAFFAMRMLDSPIPLVVEEKIKGEVVNSRERDISKLGSFPDKEGG